MYKMTRMKMMYYVQNNVKQIMFTKHLLPILGL